MSQQGALSTYILYHLAGPCVMYIRAHKEYQRSFNSTAMHEPFPKAVIRVISAKMPGKAGAIAHAIPARPSERERKPPTLCNRQFIGRALSLFSTVPSPKISRYALLLPSAGNSSLTINRVLTFMLPNSFSKSLNAYGNVILTTLLPVCPALAHR